MNFPMLKSSWAKVILRRIGSLIKGYWNEQFYVNSGHRKDEVWRDICGELDAAGFRRFRRWIDAKETSPWAVASIEAKFYRALPWSKVYVHEIDLRNYDENFDPADVNWLEIPGQGRINLSSQAGKVGTLVASMTKGSTLQEIVAASFAGISAAFKVPIFVAALVSEREIQIIHACWGEKGSWIPVKIARWKVYRLYARQSDWVEGGQGTSLPLFPAGNSSQEMVIKAAAGLLSQWYAEARRILGVH